MFFHLNKKFYILLALALCIIPTSVYAVTNITYSPPSGNIPVIMTEQAQYDFSSSNHTKCWSYSGLGGKTIHSIYGTMSMYSYNVPEDNTVTPGEQYSNKEMTQNDISIFISPINAQSDIIGTPITTHACAFTNGTLVYPGTLNTLGAQYVANLHMKNYGNYTTNESYNFNNIDVLVPNGWYVIVLNSGFGSSPSHLIFRFASTATVS